MKSFLATLFQLIFTIFLYIMGIVIIGLAAFPGFLLCYIIWNHSAATSPSLRILFIAFGAASAYFIFGLSLLIITGFIRIILNLNLKEGEYHIISAGAVKWAMANSLYLLVAATFMDFILLTPFANFFYRIMGAKVGKNCQINSKFCSDMSLLEIGDGAVIGGHATVICHSFERNRLILKKVRIGKRAIIGLNSVILPGCEIGDGALIAAGAVLSKNTIVEPRSIYFGVPAISAKERHNKEA
jgi:acetyltransferase-like isoleucine patch superfamily enzyme